MTFNNVNANAINNNDKIKITIQYKTNTFLIDTFKYKTLSYIKDKVYNHFYPIRSDINLYYMNKNLSGFEFKPLGFFFKNVNKVTIQVKDVNYNSSSNSSNNVLQRSSNYSLLSDRKISLNSSCDDVVLDNTQIGKGNQIKGVVLPVINVNVNTSISSESYNNSNNNNSGNKRKRLFQSKSQNVFMKIRAHQQSIYNIDITCSDCFINLVSYYCRTCCKFICNDCLLLTNECMGYSKHYGHKTFRLVNDGNNVYKRNIALYKDKLIEELGKARSEYENVQGKRGNEVDLGELKEKMLSEMNVVMDNVLSSVDGGNDQCGKGSDLDNALKEIEMIDIDKYKDPFEIFERINKVECGVERVVNETVKGSKRKRLNDKIDLMVELCNKELMEVKNMLQKELSKND